MIFKQNRLYIELIFIYWSKSYKYYEDKKIIQILQRWVVHFFVLSDNYCSIRIS